MFKFHRIALAALALSVFSLPTFAADPAPAAAPAPAKAAAPAAMPAAAGGGDPVVARVNGQEIHRSDVVREMQLMGPQAEKMPMQILYPELLQKMIATKIVAAQGYAEKLENEPEAKSELKDAESQIVAQLYVHRTITPKITDAKIKERYDELVSKFKPQDEVRARHILFTGPTAEADAQDAIKQIKGGADFSKLAQEKSKDTGSAKQGGDLGYFTHDVMVKEFADAAFAMKPGEISDKPVKSSFGYHVIKVEDKRKSAPPPLSEVHDQIANQLGAEYTKDLIKSLETKAKVERYNIDGTPMKTADSKPDADAKP
jgi:peptidyl-prolyl cis-trans isomerase C